MGCNARVKWISLSITNLQKLSGHHRNSALSVMKMLPFENVLSGSQLLPGSGERSVSNHVQVVKEEEESGALDELTWRMVAVEMFTDAWLSPSTQGFPVSFEISQWPACNN